MYTAADATTRRGRAAAAGPLARARPSSVSGDTRSTHSLTPLPFIRMASVAERELEKLEAAAASLPQARQRVAKERALAAAVLPPLPSDALELIFSLLPVDVRLRCREVSPAWRAFLERSLLWHVCDFAGVAKPSESLLRAATARAGGQLRVLDVTDRKEINWDTLISVAAENAASISVLRAVSCGGVLPTPKLEALLGSTTLATLQCDVQCRPPEAVRILRNEAPFGAARVAVVCIIVPQVEECDLAALSAAAAAHASLTGLHLHDAPLRSVAVLSALVDLAVSKPLTLLQLGSCGLSAASRPSLLRLLTTGSLQNLLIEEDDANIFTGHGLTAFCDALRASKLQSLRLSGVGLGRSLDAYLEYLRALTGHATLVDLGVDFSPPGEESHVAVGHALAALLDADSALHALDVSGSMLGSAGARPLFAAVARSRRLRVLRCAENDISTACARDVVLPAVQANASLRHLEFDEPGIDELEQAQALVQGRRD